MDFQVRIIACLSSPTTEHFSVAYIPTAESCSFATDILPGAGNQTGTMADRKRRNEANVAEKRHFGADGHTDLCLCRGILLSYNKGQCLLDASMGLLLPQHKPDLSW